MTWPPCGLYRTTRALDDIPAGRLVSFHNHGEPGPGVYLPKSWALNRVEWQPKGHVVPGPEWSATLAPLPSEGLYVVREAFHCCEKKCVHFHAQHLVQLGYDAEGTPILFVPEWTARGLGFPERGTRLDSDRLTRLSLLQVARGPDSPTDVLLH